MNIQCRFPLVYIESPLLNLTAGCSRVQLKIADTKSNTPTAIDALIIAISIL
jgi:hypothetical protein